MQVNVNVQKFINIIFKATLNYSVDYLQLHFIDGRIKSGMVTDNRGVVTLLDIENDGIIGVTKNDDIVFNFSEPNRKLISFLNLIDEDEAKMEIVEDEKIVIKSGKGARGSVVTFCRESILQNNVLKKSSNDNIPYFHELEITDDILNVTFEKIRKIGTLFGKIYVTIEDGVLYLESSDKNNVHTDGHREFLADNIEIDDLSICFDYPNFCNLMEVLKDSRGSGKEFEMKFAYLRERNGGMIHTTSTDGTEQYFLINRES